MSAQLRQLRVQQETTSKLKKKIQNLCTCSSVCRPRVQYPVFQNVWLMTKHLHMCCKMVTTVKQIKMIFIPHSFFPLYKNTWYQFSWEISSIEHNIPNVRSHAYVKNLNYLPYKISPLCHFTHILLVHLWRPSFCLPYLCFHLFRIHMDMRSHNNIWWLPYFM